MKIAVFQDDHSPFIGKMINNLGENFVKTVDKPILYSGTDTHKVSFYSTVIDPNLTYLINSKSHKIYASFLDYCEANKIEKAFIPRLHHPEILLSELSVRSSLQTNLTCCIYGLQDIYGSKARERIYSELIKNSNINSLIIFSIAGEKLKISPILSKSISKINLLYDPIYEDPSIYEWSKAEARSQLNLNQKTVYGLFFGSFFYGKGVDILVDAVSILPEDINLKIIIAGNPKTLNFKYDIEKLRNNKKIDFIDKFIPEVDAAKLFRATDFVILPYRSTYAGGTSGVLVQSVLAQRPIISPDIYPFNSVVQEYGLGKCFFPGDTTSLGKLLTPYSTNHKQVSSNANFRGYLRNIQNWDAICKIIIS